MVYRWISFCTQLVYFILCHDTPYNVIMNSFCHIYALRYGANEPMKGRDRILTHQPEIVGIRFDIGLYVGEKLGYIKRKKNIIIRCMYTLAYIYSDHLKLLFCPFMMTSSNGNIVRVTGPLCGEFTGHRWIPWTKANDAELWCFLWYASWINGWVNNRGAGDLRRQHAHYDVIVMSSVCIYMITTWHGRAIRITGPLIKDL